MIFAVIFGLAVYVARQDERAAQEAAQNAAHFGNKTVLTKTEGEHSQGNVGNTERNAPSWYGFFRWPNGTTTWAIILTLLAIAEQTKETAKAAKASAKAAEAAERSITLQEAMNQQWVDVDDWRIEGRDHYEKSIPDTLTIAFSIENTTSAPFAVERITATVSGEVWTSESANVMSHTDGARDVRIPVRFLPGWAEDYRRDRLPLVLDGAITFVDCVGNRRVQPIGHRFAVGIKYWSHGTFGATDGTSYS